jgi:error-prone DNA polymerase
MPGRVVVQWDKDDCADLGIVKVDLLGLGMMAVIKDSLVLIRDHYREEVDLAHLPADDPAVYQTIRKADTVGMFQIESRAQMASLPRNRPERFYDLVVQVALIRPGPIVGQMANPYMKRRQGLEAVKYPHASLEPVLERTLGVPLFQEQLLRMAMICANFTGGEAEELRRALGSRRSHKRMQEIEAKLRTGMSANGIPPATQDEIVQFIVSFALYGFPESHAASFALLAYASAYLKEHYLAAFTAALLNNQPMGFYHPSTLVKDAQRHGLKVKPIDVTCSDWDCTIEDDAQRSTIAMRMGLRYVRGLREAAARELLVQRAIRPFDSIEDLTLRAPSLSKKDLVMLAQIGALNKICRDAAKVDVTSYVSTQSAKPHRRDALWQVERTAQPAGPLLEALPEKEVASPLAQMTTEERLVADFHGTGLTVGPHPMSYRRAQMEAMRVLPASALGGVPNGRRVRVAGAIIARQRPGTAHGFIFLSLEDETGISNVIVRPDIYDRDRMILLRERFLLVEGIMQNQENVLSVKAERLERLHISAAQMSSHDFH